MKRENRDTPWRLVRAEAPFYFSSGIVPSVRGEFATQFDDVMGQVESRLVKEGLTLNNLVAVDVHLRDIRRDFQEFSEMWSETFGDSPAIARVTTQSVMRDENWLLEVNFVAKSSRAL